VEQPERDAASRCARDADADCPAEAWAHWRWLHPSKDSFALSVRGDSMVCTTGDMSFPELCIIIVDPDIRPVVGHHVVVRLKDASNHMFRLLDQEGDTLVLRALNPKYPTRPLPADARILGVVIAKQIQLCLAPGGGAAAAA
jgi:SOS-response transcriptional repressor LexA